MNNNDLTGKKFNRLTVLYQNKERKNNRIIWHCLCDCGNEIDVSGTSLRTGHTQSCGCLHKDVMRNMKFKDLTGKQFGILKVLKLDGFDTVRNAIWECQCQCGKKSYVTGNNLLQGNTKSCGCRSQFINNLTGQKFGMLTALRPTIERKGSSVVWECQCDCGKICKVASNSLINGHTNSCGCLISKGEARISQILKEHNIVFEQQKTFENCRFPDTNALARFDFYLPEQNVLIEYDGKQHFDYDKNGWNTKDNFIKTQQHDQFKNQWCKDNNFYLIRIPYTCFDDIENILLKEVFNV